MERYLQMQILLIKEIRYSQAVKEADEPPCRCAKIVVFNCPMGSFEW